MDYRQLVNEKIKANTPITPIKVGDVVKVGYKIKEGDKERVQIFEGRVISIKGGLKSNSSAFTVRKKVDAKYSVERIFPVFSPSVIFVDVVTRAKVRRAKLTFLRDFVGDFRFKEKRVNIKAPNSVDVVEEVAEVVEEEA